MTDRQRERLAMIRRKAPKYAGIFERVYAASRPRKNDMLRAKCLDCCGYQEREAVGCTTETCALWIVNPYRKARLCNTMAWAARRNAERDAGGSTQPPCAPPQVGRCKRHQRPPEGGFR